MDKSTTHQLIRVTPMYRVLNSGIFLLKFVLHEFALNRRCLNMLELTFEAI